MIVDFIADTITAGDISSSDRSILKSTWAHARLWLDRDADQSGHPSRPFPHQRNACSVVRSQTWTSWWSVYDCPDGRYLGNLGPQRVSSTRYFRKYARTKLKFRRPLHGPT